jgi:hypothetical protein
LKIHKINSFTKAFAAKAHPAVCTVEGGRYYEAPITPINRISRVLLVAIILAASINLDVGTNFAVDKNRFRIFEF